MRMPWAPRCYYGPGAGAEPTASSVIADIVDVARDHELPTLDTWVPALGCSSASALQPQKIMAIQDIETSFYIRFAALDQPGVLSDITGDNGRCGYQYRGHNSARAACG